MMPAMLRLRRRRLYVVAAALIATAVIVSASVTALASRTPQPTEPPPPQAPISLRDMAPRTEYERLLREFEVSVADASPAELDAAEDELFAELEKRGYVRLRNYSGPETKGAAVSIAGKTITLPADAQVGAILAVGLALVGPGTPEFSDDSPVMLIERGDSFVWIDMHTGRVTDGGIAPGGEGAFDFLKESFPDEEAVIDSLPVKPPEGEGGLGTMGPPGLDSAMEVFE